MHLIPALFFPHGPPQLHPILEQPQTQGEHYISCTLHMGTQESTAQHPHVPHRMPLLPHSPILESPEFLRRRKRCISHPEVQRSRLHWSGQVPTDIYHRCPPAFHSPGLALCWNMVYKRLCRDHGCCGADRRFWGFMQRARVDTSLFA